MRKHYIGPECLEICLETQTYIQTGSEIGSYDVEGLIIEDELDSEWQ